MAKSANGTIDPDFEQVVQQRAATQGRNLSNGILNERSLGISKQSIGTLFAKSPLILANRKSDAASSRDPDDIQDEDGDIYAMYANVVDPENAVSSTGFGFYGTDTVKLNYNHENNPFIDNDVANFEALTTGLKATATDESTRHHKGFPDLQPHSTLNSVPTEGTASELGAAVNFNRDATQSFGSEVRHDRAQQDAAYPSDTRGSYEVEPTATVDMTDTMEKDANIGQYFRRNYANATDD